MLSTPVSDNSKNIFGRQRSDYCHFLKLLLISMHSIQVLICATSLFTRLGNVIY